MFKAAAAGLRRWEQFRFGWLSASPGDTPIEPEQCVAVVAHTVGVWCLNAAKIVYVVDEPRRFGIASPKVAGTLRVPWRLRHAERAYYIDAPRFYRTCRPKCSIISSAPGVILRSFSAMTPFSEVVAFLSRSLKCSSFLRRCRRRLISCLRSLIPPTFGHSSFGEVEIRVFASQSL